MKYPILFFVSVAIAACGLGVNTATAQSEKPNVLFIGIDDLNDWVGVMGGHPQALTPNIDRLAERSVLFTNAYCAAPACNPSRAALMTGLAPYETGVYMNGQPWREPLKNVVTLPKHFSDNGYWSAGSGKMFHGRFPDPGSWDDYYPDPINNRFDDPNPVEKNWNGLGKGNFDWGGVPAPDSEMGDYKTASWISNQLSREREKPFFLACGFYRPHLPWYAPRKYFDLFPIDEIVLPKVNPDDLDDLPKGGLEMAHRSDDHKVVTEAGKWKHAVQAYLANMAFVDHQVGRVLNALDAGPHRDSTIVVLWTDHGWSLGEKENWRKFALWSNPSRTPLMISVPRGFEPLPEGAALNQRCSQPASLLDLYPTLIELCGLSSRDGLSGESLVPLLRDPLLETGHAVVTTHGRNNHAIKDARWRYIRYADGGEELYDTLNDPEEWINLASDPEHAETRARMGKWLPENNAPDVPYAD